MKLGTLAVALCTLIACTDVVLSSSPRSKIPGSGLDSSLPGSPERATQEEAMAWAGKILAGLDLERKIGQIVCSDLAGGYIADDDPRLKQWIRLARDLKLGMFVLYGGTPRDAAHLLNRLQKEADIPILVAADFEGGPGQQVTGASEFPANMAFSAAGSADLLYRAAAVAAVEGRAMGIHLTYTPVVDIEP